LINGAGGGVGTIGVQIAKMYDVTITGVDSKAKFDIMNELGFDNVIDYLTEDFAKNGEKYDLILDNKTNRSIISHLRSLNQNGVYVSTGGQLSKVLIMFLLSPLIKLLTKKNLRIVGLKPNKDLLYINRLFDENKIKSVIDGYYSFEELPNAFKYYEDGEFKGKIVISVIDEK